jgi:hypothetical protein
MAKCKNQKSKIKTTIQNVKIFNFALRKATRLPRDFTLSFSILRFSFLIVFRFFVFYVLSNFITALVALTSHDDKIIAKNFRKKKTSPQLWGWPFLVLTWRNTISCL